MADAAPPPRPAHSGGKGKAREPSHAVPKADGKGSLSDMSGVAGGCFVRGECVPFDEAMAKRLGVHWWKWYLYCRGCNHFICCIPQRVAKHLESGWHKRVGHPAYLQL